ncbi:MAG: 2-hydroxyacyl-CoA dehydratase [Proteobacteria bacterium]|nr:2-hydroxyacyl-CoA dehydratase [Pseudomonadota bacterium]
MELSKRNSKRLVYSSPFIPAEWIAAHGLTPCFLRPRGSDAGGPVEDRAGVCAYMRGFINEAVSDLETDGIIVTTVCDQMRRSVDLLCNHLEKPLFLMHVPATWQTPVAHQYYISELRRLGTFLVYMGGNEPTKAELVSTMEAYERGRASIVANPSLMHGVAFTDALTKYFLTARIPDTQSKVAKGIPIAVVGGHLSHIDCQIFTLIEEQGGAIVLDGTENGERALPGRFDRRRLREEPLSVLAEAYFAHIPDVFFRPNTNFFSWLKKEVRIRDVKGVVLVRYIWCDCWHAEVQRIRDWLDVPVIDIDLTGEDCTLRSSTRIQAFMETLI